MPGSPRPRCPTAARSSARTLVGQLTQASAAALNSRPIPAVQYGLLAGGPGLDLLTPTESKERSAQCQQNRQRRDPGAFSSATTAAAAPGTRSRSAVSSPPPAWSGRSWSTSFTPPGRRRSPTGACPARSSRPREDFFAAAVAELSGLEVETRAYVGGSPAGPQRPRRGGAVRPDRRRLAASRSPRRRAAGVNRADPPRRPDTDRHRAAGLRGRRACPAREDRRRLRRDRGVPARSSTTRRRSPGRPVPESRSPPSSAPGTLRSARSNTRSASLRTRSRSWSRRATSSIPASRSAPGSSTGTTAAALSEACVSGVDLLASARAVTAPRPASCSARYRPSSSAKRRPPC